MRAIARAAVIVAAALSVAVCAPAFGQSQQSKTEKEPTGSIAGRVTMEGKVAAGVTVILSSNENGPRLKQPIKTTSDAEGNFKFTRIPAGNYGIQTFTPAFVGNDQNAPYAMGKSVLLSDGEEVEDINIALTRGGVITGRLTDSAGQPLIEERIVLIRIGERGQKSSIYSQYGYSPMMQTDDRGIYRIYGLPAGRYLVGVGMEKRDRFASIGYRNNYYERTYYPDASDESQATIVEVTPGGEAKDIDIKVSRQSKGYAASGRIVDGVTGKPLSGMQYGVATVNAQNKRFEGSSYVSNFSNARGEFRIEGLQPGHYAAITGSDNQAGLYSEAAVFEVMDGDVGGLEIKVYRGSSVSGQVIIEGISAQQSQALMAELQIGIQVNSSERMPSPNHNTVKLGPGGSFNMLGLPPGQVQFNLMTRNGNLLPVLRVERDGVNQGKNIDVQAGESLTGVKIYFGYGNGRIRGQVKVEGGTVPDGVRISVYARGLAATDTFIGGNAIADARGNFIIEQLPPGDYEVTIAAFRPSSGLSVDIRPVKQKVTVSDESEVQLTVNLDLAPKKGSRQ